MRSLTAFIIRKSLFGFAVAAIIIAGAVTSCTSMQQHEGGLPEPEDAERLMTAWLDIPQCRIVGVAGNSDDGWMVACNTFPVRRDPYGMLAHISPGGIVLNTMKFSGRSLELQSILKLHDGNYLLAGTDSPTYRDRQMSEIRQFDTLTDPITGETFTVTNYISANFLVWKLTPDGETMWRQNYRRYDSDSAADNYLSAVLETPDGGLVFVGTTMPENIGYAIRVLRTDRDGEPLSDTTYTPFGNLMCDYAILMPDGEILIGGTVNAIHYESARTVLMKIGTGGEVVWSRKYDEHGSEILHSMVRTNDGAIAIAGRSYDEDGNSLAFLKKVDEDGRELWTRRYDAEVFNAVAATVDGTLLVTAKEFVMEIDDEGKALRQLRPRELNVHEIATVISRDDNLIMLAGSATPPEKEGGEYKGAQGFLATVRR